MAKASAFNFVYIGRKFYWESKTAMGSLYGEDGYRADWGKIEMALEAGADVHIRPASVSELARYQKELDERKAKELING